MRELSFIIATHMHAITTRVGWVFSALDGVIFGTVEILANRVNMMSRYEKWEWGHLKHFFMLTEFGGIMTKTWYIDKTTPFFVVNT